jgi:predicted SnoaL-like aldol condensation-catalyzing enzyme
MSFEHVERAKEVWKEFESGNIAAVFDELSDDVVVHFSGRHKFSGDVKGKDALMDYYSNFLTAFPGFQMGLHATMGDEDHLVQLVKVTYVHGEESITDNMAIVSHVGSDGKITEQWYQDGDQYMVDEFVERFHPKEA